MMIYEAETLLDRVIENYRLKRILGRGGSSVVFLGQRLHNPLDQAAIKVLWPPTSLPSDEVSVYRKRFLREAQILQERLHHPHIVQVLAYGEDAVTGIVFMVMPYIRGDTLTEHARKAPLSLDTIASYVTQLAEALDYAHQRQVLHRDLKPNNVLLDEQQQVYLLDFGIAKLVDLNGSRLTSIGGVIGTPDYMSPEQARGGTVSTLSDIYGLGALTYTLVTGHGLFPPAPAMRMLLQVLSKAPVPPRSYRPDLSIQVEEVLLRVLSKEPADRFATAGAFAEAFVQATSTGKALQDVIVSAPVEVPTAIEELPLPGDLAEIAGDLHNDNVQADKVLSSDVVPVTNKVRRSISRRALLIGGLTLTGVGGSILWATQAFSASDSLSMGSSSTPRTALTPLRSTPISTATGTNSSQASTPSNPTPAATAPLSRLNMPPLRTVITNLPTVVVNDTAVFLALHASLAQAKVILHVTYPVAGNSFTSPPVTTNAQGFAAIFWPVHTPDVSYHQTVDAILVVTATDNIGQQTFSVSARISVIKGT